MTPSPTRTPPVSRTTSVRGKAKYIPNRIKRYHERSLDGCLTCRKRRVKCDEHRPTCQRCACAQRQCLYADSTAAETSAASSSSLDRSASTHNGRRTPRLPVGLGFDNLQPYFPSYEEQSLFRHYLLSVAPQLCVMPSRPEDNRWILHHATFAVRSPAGTNKLEDALRSALLSTASLDIAHKLSHTQRDSADTLLYLSHLRREDCLRLLRAALTGRVTPLARPDAAIMLATVLGLGTRDRLAAQQDWQEALSIASKAIAQLGGPAALVDTTDPPTLFLLEQIACFDALSSLTSDDYTLFLQPWDDWWYALMDSPLTEDSVLQTFGLQRGMIDMLARMTRVEATRRDLQARTGLAIILSDEIGAGSPPHLPPEYDETRRWLESTACALVAEIPIWAKLPLDPGVPDLMHQLYLAAAELYIHSVIFSRPADHACFRQPTSVILDRSEHAVRVGVTKGLLLPISFAAFSADRSDRARIQNLLNDLRPHYQFDLERMENLNQHLWGLVDSGLTPSDWQLFLKSVGCFNWAF